MGISAAFGLNSSRLTQTVARAAFGRQGALVYNSQPAPFRRQVADRVWPSRIRRIVLNRLAEISLVSIILVLAVVAALGIGYAVGRARQRDSPAPATLPQEPPRMAAAPLSEEPPRAAASEPSMPTPPTAGELIAERARIIRNFEAETAVLRRALVSRDADITQLAELAVERRRLFGDLATSRGETARYRQLVIDLENDAPPPFFGTGAPDDLKLIVGVGPVLERMLHQLGVATYRQIARWSERDIDDFDAKLHEFPGRIRRDAWVTQARALHQSKYGEALPLRERR
jgi:predicted flap endonuclease-1-like 5' DNA nuclease